MAMADRDPGPVIIRFSLLSLMMSGCSGMHPADSPVRKHVDLQGHRGARGYRPENSIPAFRYCIESGMNTIELDTTLTADRRFIICHDTVLNSRLCVDRNGNPAPAPSR